jgi:hypothetical protein
LDTKIENGQLVQDKCLLIKSLKIDDVLLLEDDIYHIGRILDESGNKTQGTGLYTKNSQFIFYFTNPAVKYFIKLRKFYFSEKFSTSDLLDKLADLFTHAVDKD